MVGMSTAVSSSSLTYIAKVAMGYSWLESTAGPALRQSLNQSPYVKVVLALGVNDLGNIQRYISYYQTLIRTYPDTRFYILAVNPVDESKEAVYGYSVKNTDIKTFNKKMKAAFGASYLPSYGYLTQNGFETSDGVHYTAATYQKLYNYIMGKIG